MTGIVTKQVKDGAGALFNTYWFDDGTGTLSPLQQWKPAQATVVTPRNATLSAATDQAVFPGGSPVRMKFRNTGGNDAQYHFGSAAGVANDQQLLVGEEVEVPFTWAGAVHFYSAAGTTIEGLEWS